MAEVSEQSKHNLVTLSKMKQFHSDGKFWDIQIEVNNRFFKCQRSVLAANSKYFYTMFCNDFEDSVKLHKVDDKAFEDMLHFMYTGEIWVKDSNVLQLLFLNDLLQLGTAYVKKQCLQHVKNRSQRNDEPISNALELLWFAHQKGENVLFDTLRSHICSHLYHYSRDARLMETSFEILNALLEFSKDYILPLLGSANVPLIIVQHWISHNREERSQYRTNLMENINFANVSANCSRPLINRLENAVDDLVNFSKDINSLSELKKLVMGIDTNLTYGDAKLDGEIIEFNFKNMSKMPIDKKAYSSLRIISGLSWKIGVDRNEIGYLGMYLFCDGASFAPEWNCYAFAKFTILSHKKGQKHFVSQMSHNLFTSDQKTAASGPRSLMKWEDMKDPKNGFIEDDSITLNVRIYAYVPFLKR